MKTIVEEELYAHFTLGKFGQLEETSEFFFHAWVLIEFLRNGF
jgi:hypothetical protein